MKRPPLNKVDFPGFHNIKGCAITMSPGQWDMMLDESYKQGFLLIEVGRNEKVIAAYRIGNS